MGCPIHLVLPGIWPADLGEEKEIEADYMRGPPPARSNHRTTRPFPRSPGANAPPNDSRQLAELTPIF